MAAVAAVAAAAAVGVVALAFALYAVMRDIVGPAGASASVAGAVALILLLVGLVATARSGFGRRKAGLAERAAAFAKDKPLAAAATALAAGFFAIRNPKTLAAILRELMEPKGRRRP